MARQLIITSHTRVRCTLKSFGYSCKSRSVGLCGRFLHAIRIFGRGRNGVTLSGGVVPHELDQGQREALVVGKLTERRTAGMSALSGISSWCSRHDLCNSADALVGWAQVPET